jgi:hypothetical protein
LYRGFSVEQPFARHFCARDVDVLLRPGACDHRDQKHTRSQDGERSHHLDFQSNLLSQGALDGGRITSPARSKHCIVAPHHYTWHKGMLQLR